MSKFRLKSFLAEPKSRDPKDKRASRRSSHKRLSKNISETDIEQELSPIATTKKVFLYLHLQSIKNLPTTGNRIIMKVTHKANKITKLVDHYSEDHSVDLTNLEGPMPTFGITIEQDSIEDLNSLSDNPLIITLYEVIPPPLKGEEDTSEGEDGHISEEPHYEPIAQGCIDLLQCFSTKRCLAMDRIYLYPIVNMKSSTLLPTTTTVWQMYTLIPLLRELSFCNIAFLTFESIYNAPPDIMENTEDLMADLYLQSKVPNAKKQFDKVKLCSYSLFTRTIIATQNDNIKWENLKYDAINAHHLGLYTGAKVSLHKLFERLFCTEGANFNFRNISCKDDEALVCNSVHRHILTKEISAILEEVVAFNRQQILVEVFRSASPAKVLMHGTLDLSVLLYPRVNACRFAVQLHHILKPKPKSKKQGAEKSKKLPGTASTATASATVSFTRDGRRSKESLHANESLHSKSSVHGKGTHNTTPSKTPFAIIAICLLSPITEGDDQFPIYNDSRWTKEKLKRCLKISKEMALLPLVQVAEENYTLFDELIGAMIEYILTNKVTSTDDAKNYFCCQLGNFSKRILKLIAADFNKRFPTNSNIEFTKLMTTVYKELTERIYHILKNCNHRNLELCFVRDVDMLAKIVHFMNISKFMYEVGDVEVADLLFGKIWKENVKYPELRFYKFLYDTEMHNFDDAKEYIRRAKTEKWLAVEYFVEWVDIYIKYMEKLKHEQSYNQALENLLIALQDLIEKYPADADGWILMHSLYRKYSYLPGVSFTRWKYEGFYEKRRRSLPTIPKCRWALYNNFQLYFHTDKGHNFYQVFNLFVQLGLYKFAEFVFTNIAKECADVERHLTTTTLKVLLKEKDKKTTVKWFDVEKAFNSEELRAYLAQINGSWEYFEGATAEAIRTYGYILDLEELQHFEDYELSLLRYGYHMLEHREYHHALRAFDKCFMGGNRLAANIIMGKTLYRANYLKEAEKFFAKSTYYEMHIPNVWGYLALINLKLGNNFKALEFWKYAKLNPDNVISDEILEELQKINYNDVFLYVDKPV